MKYPSFQIISSSEARDNFADYSSQVMYQNKRFLIIRNGKPVMMWTPITLKAKEVKVAIEDFNFAKSAWMDSTILPLKNEDK